MISPPRLSYLVTWGRQDVRLCECRWTDLYDRAGYVRTVDVGRRVAGGDIRGVHQRQGRRRGLPHPIVIVMGHISLKAHNPGSW